MEEELSENELEGQMYAILHYVDETQKNVSTNQKDVNFVENVPHSTLRRYWHGNSDFVKIYQKINVPKESAVDKNVFNSSQPIRKNEEIFLPPSDLSIFQQPVSENIKRTVEILENEDLNRVVELESSDEDEVIEITLPPKPTITIESSDDEANTTLIKPTDEKVVEIHEENKENRVGKNREVSASPVPSVVSSISDEFIRGDCIALNISSRHVSKHSFDFSLHGSDLLDQTPARKKKKKRTKEATSTPVAAPANSTPSSVDNECFATPRSKAKNKKQRNKSYRVTEKSVPNADVYDSDSNQSVNEVNKNPNPYSVTDKSLPNIDVYESDSNQCEVVKGTLSKSDNVVDKAIDTSASDSLESMTTSASKTPKKNSDVLNNTITVDLTEAESICTALNENIVMGNVSGLTDAQSYSDDNTLTLDSPKCGSTKIPAILSEDLDFDNLKGNNRVCKRRRYSLTTLRAEMEKFYNESWGGEDFNHREIQKNMSRDKNLWVIDPKDKMSSFAKRKSTCNYCNRMGHRDDTCRMKPPVCFMCGSTGHFEPRCPRKICVNCGSPNHMYSTMCRKCSTWNTIRCAECGQHGHPSSHCPDLWRRYHNTTDLHMPLEENRQFKKHYQIFCSGCTRRGHFVHTCRISLPFSGLPINSPYVAVYRPIYSPMLNNDCSQMSNPNNQCKSMSAPQNPHFSPASTPRNELLKRQSKSPVNHETHLCKKKNLGTSHETQITQRPININNLPKKNVQNKEQLASSNKDTGPNKNMKTTAVVENQTSDKVPDIPVTSENHDKRGQIIQDNEVSDTSDVFTSARIYVTKEVSEKLKTEEGNLWLKETVKKNNVTLESENIIFYVRIKGTVGNQEAFQAELRDWVNSNHLNQKRSRSRSDTEADITQEVNNDHHMSNDIPKNRNNVLRKLNRAFETLKTDLGEPKLLYRELVYLQNRHQELLKQKVIRPQQLSKNKTNINGMLRKLNMVLLGQAGLADGSKHLNELHLLQEKLTNFRQKNIPTILREEIGQHFHYIFTTIPRNDYVELLSKFYNRPATTFKNNQNNTFYKSVPAVTQKHNRNRTFKKHVNIESNGTNNNNGVDNVTVTVTETTKKKLRFYHRRLIHFRPTDVVLRKTKIELVKQLHSQIAALGQKRHTSKQNFKRMKKIQEQVRLFLSNI